MSVIEVDRFKKFRELPAVAEALRLLSSQLPNNLLYHAYPHTEDVISEVLKLASLDRLSDRDAELIVVAAAWHDVGFIYAPQHNEPMAAEAAKRFLTSLATYSPQEISQIEAMILDTALVIEGGQLRQKPSRSSLSRYLLDADLANFGRDDFFDKSELQRQEINEEVAPFRRKTLALLENHVWLTPAAQMLWQAKKSQNLEALRKLVTINP